MLESLVAQLVEQSSPLGLCVAGSSPAGGS